MHTLEQLGSGSLAGVRRLDLSCGLTTLPDEIFDLADTLEVLNLSGNRLRDLPHQLPRLHKLQVLFASDNDFTVLPEVLGDCPALQMVGFKANRIAHVPAAALPPALRWLTLTDNAIGHLPTELALLPFIESAFNPQAVHGQSNGAAAQAMGWALYEQLQLDGGRLVNGNFADYTMPTADALPELQSGIIESNDPNGPHGAKGASETAILPGAPAIANAVFDAVGVRITDLPITPEKVLAALRLQKQAGSQTSLTGGAAHA